MKGISIMAGLLALIVGAALAIQARLAGSFGGNLLLVFLGLLALWPSAFLLWAFVQVFLFARGSRRAALRVAQEVDRCGRAGEKLVLGLLRFPPLSPLDFPFFPSHRAVLDELRQRFRTYDQVERTGFAAYILILPGTDSVGAVTIRERLLETVRREQRWRIRVGVSIHPEDGLTPEILLDHAERHSA